MILDIIWNHPNRQANKISLEIIQQISFGTIFHLEYLFEKNIFKLLDKLFNCGNFNLLNNIIAIMNNFLDSELNYIDEMNKQDLITHIFYLSQ